MSVVGLALTLYFLLVLRGSQLMPERLIGEVQGLLKAGRLTEAREACSGRRCAVASIARSAIEYALGVESPDPGMVREIIEGEGGRQASYLRDQVQYLHDIAVIAPMIGLLGTVMGMLSAFNSVALDIARAKPMVLAAGVSQALITTAAGLIVGIPAMMAFAFFRGRASRLISALEAVSAEMLTALVRERAP
jgi:biopolymer transport protein ExbB